MTAWKPQVTKLSDLKGPGGAMPPGYDETFVQKTSLAANKPVSLPFVLLHLKIISRIIGIEKIWS